MQIHSRLNFNVLCSNSISFPLTQISHYFIILHIAVRSVNRITIFINMFVVRLFLWMLKKEVDKDLILPAKVHVGQAGFYQIRHM